jgi:hypothetical protein
MEWINQIWLSSYSERAIGEIGHKVRSKKAPFANIATCFLKGQISSVDLAISILNYTSPRRE